MSHIGQVLDVEHVVAPIAQITHDDVKRDVGFGVAHMRVVIHGRTTDVHIDLALVQRLKKLLFPVQDVVRFAMP